MGNILTNSDDNLAITENGALGYATSGNAIVDFFFNVPTLRAKNALDVINEFNKVVAEEGITVALKMMYYLRDVRKGMGERKTYRTLLKHAVKTLGSIDANILYEDVGEIGRWDDILVLFDNDVPDDIKYVVGGYLRLVLSNDMDCVKNGCGCSLLAKWLPSTNTSSKETRKLSAVVRKYMVLTKKEYNHCLVTLRSHIDIVEKKMSDGKWENIDYEAVPTKSNLRYNTAFYKHDQDRRQEYINALKTGEAKVNASCAYPNEYVHKILGGTGDVNLVDAMWKEYVSHFKNTLSDSIVVCDVSGSMEFGSMTGPQPISSSIGMALWFAHFCRGEFHNKVITFSTKPSMISVDTDNLGFTQNVNLLKNADWGGNTDIEKVFMLILNAAIKSKTAPEDMPKNVITISDMEFDGACRGRCKERLFETISKAYLASGYTLPKMIFWNVAQRNASVVPMVGNENGLILVSGNSPIISEMILTGELTPRKAILKILNDGRYPQLDKLT